MKLFKKRYIAIACVAIVAVLFSLIGIKLSVTRQADKIESIFISGINGETGIQTYLDNACNEAKVIHYTASAYLDREYTEGLRSAYNSLYEAETISKKHDCFENVISETDSLEALLNASTDISEDDRIYLSTHMENMKNIQRMIETSSYNEQISEFEQKILNVFPVSLLKGILRLEAPEYFD